eukprot:symbB.v1.2.031856.t1/scaffold3744.1/size51060/4
MSDGYEQQEGQLAVVARPQAPLKLEPFSSEVWEHPRVARQELGFGIATMFAFHRRSSAFYQTLADIAHFLPKEGRQCQEANDLVKHQRCWMYDVGCAVGSVVSTCYQLESNTLKELDAMFQTGQQKLPIALAKANFRVTLKNLQSLGAERELARQKIAELEALATQMVTWQGQEKKMQHAVMDVLSKFGGSAQCQAYLDDLQANQAALTKARDAERAAAQKLSQIAGRQDELQCQSIVYEGIANNEAGRLQTLQTRAKKLDDDAAQRAEEAAKTLNIAYQKRSGWFGQWVTDWVDNRGDCAKWRAERFRDIARKAKEEEGDQGTLAKKANSELADVKGKLTAVKKDMEDALKVLGSAAQATAAAEEALKETQQKVKALRHEHGDLNLCQIAALRDHMQKFPELLGATGVQDHSMFATMKGELKYHENLCARLTEFLALNDEACEHPMLVLRPEIAKAIENSKFFSTELGPLKNKIDEQIAGMEKMAIEHGNIPTPSRAAGSAPVPEARQPLFVSLADEDEEEDVF